MVSIEDLRKVVLFENLTAGMLEKLAPIAESRSLGEREIIYEAGDRADNFYCLKRGKVVLEAELAPTVIIALGAIKPGYSFGWSSLLSSPNHTSYAASAEPSEVLSIPGKKLRSLLDQDHTMGFLISQKVARILENRLERRTAQFLKVISKHPEIGTLLGV